MMTNDPIADLLTRIRNAVRARKFTVTVPTSKMKQAICDILVKSGYLENATLDDASLVLKVSHANPPSELKRISKPGQRIYLKSTDIKPVRFGLGIGIYSTSHGVLPDKEVRKQKLGGEYLCEIF